MIPRLSWINAKFALTVGSPVGSGLLCTFGILLCTQFDQPQFLRDHSTKHFRNCGNREPNLVPANADKTIKQLVDRLFSELT